jgi:NADP-dependent 3-hydroxy acid dehydrogenase YdfG
MGIGADDKVLVVAGSMNDSKTPAKIIHATMAKFRRIDVLVNSAGAPNKPGVKDAMSLEQLDYLYTVNYRRWGQKALKNILQIS